MDQNYVLQNESGLFLKEMHHDIPEWCEYVSIAKHTDKETCKYYMSLIKQPTCIIRNVVKNELPNNIQDHLSYINKLPSAIVDFRYVESDDL